MVVIGLLLVLLGWLFGVSVLTTLGVVLLVVGLVLLVLGATGHPVGGRTWW